MAALSSSLPAHTPLVTLDLSDLILLVRLNSFFCQTQSWLVRLKVCLSELLVRLNSSLSLSTLACQTPLLIVRVDSACHTHLCLFDSPLACQTQPLLVRFDSTFFCVTGVVQCSMLLAEHSNSNLNMLVTATHASEQETISVSG